MTFHVDIVSAEHAIFSGSAQMVFAPAEMGELGITPRHAPLLTRLKPGSVRVKISEAAVPMRGFSRQTQTGPAHTYLTIQNLGAADELVAVRSPVARHVVLTRRDGLTRPSAVGGLPLPAGGILVLTPLTDDVVLVDPVRYEGNAEVPLTLVFRHAGTITIKAPVTAPGTP